MTPADFENGVNNILDSTKPKGVDGSKGITKAIFKQIVVFFKNLLTETINTASSAGYKDLTSVTSITIGTGSKTFTTNKASTSSAFIAGLRVRVINTTTPTKYMEGIITSFTGTTLVVNVDYVAGSGTYAVWEVAVSGQKGIDGSNSVSGTQNFLQKLNSVLGFVNSLIYDDGSKVGVDIVPEVKLHVNGTNASPATSGSSQPAIFRLGQIYDNMVMDFGISAALNSAWIQVTNRAALGNFYGLFFQPNGGPTQFGGKVKAISFFSVSGSVALSHNVASVIYSISNPGRYEVFSYIYGVGAANYTSAATILCEGTQLRLIANNGGLLAISNTGLDIRLTQTSGTALEAQWYILKMGE